MKKRLFSVLIALVVLIGMTAAAWAQDEVQDTAYLMYADAGWTYQYWGGDAENGIIAKNDTVTGAGDYTVGLDFTKTEAGKAEGLAFTAVGITKGEETFPGYFIEITSIKVNGQDIAFEKGYTSSDDGITTRMNIYNEWVADLPVDARSFDDDISNVKPIIVDKDAFTSVETIEVAFTLHEGVADIAYIMYADGGWTYQYWGGEPEGGIVANNATILGDGEYTVGLDFTGTESGAANGIAFTALGVVTGEQTFPGSFIKLNWIKINGSEIALEKKGYTSSDDEVTTRMNIYNEWVTELLDDARSFDGDISEAAPIIVNKDAFAEVKTIEINFEFILGEAGAEKEVVEIDAEAALAKDYNAYFGVQTVSYIFRNAWNDSYGIDTPNWTRLTGWDGPEEVNYGGSFTDAQITGNGTYTVSAELGEMGFGEDENFNMLFVSTDIPSALIDGGYLTISDVKTSMDGRVAREYTFVDTEEDFAKITVMNTYNSDVGTETIAFIMPTERIDITFTVDGFPREAMAVSEGGLPLWAIILIIFGSVVIVGGAIVLVVVSKKKNA